ncbi:MAG: phosphoribosylanthranilate isomerase [Chlorobium sp.]|nr:MAG: phosphoribosylanthranilate isomerase [Chlorobium sp.]
MTKIKICGITSLEDALDACKAGADALGFNFSNKSPRVITPERAREIIRNLPPFVQSAGIFVEHSPEEIEAICRHSGLQIAQLHSDRYSAEQARSITVAKVIKVFHPDKDFSVEQVRLFAENSGINTFLFDAYRPNMVGGTGERIDASLATRIFDQLGNSCYAILAGGLNEKNVGEAIRQTNPYGVDTASGVEKEPGIKDSAKIKSFIRAVQKALL